ncbi:GNAT family N-acetyltransferase [Microvirga roseola]|uniref:GNAT family N-acetyltransferase n=1 Tax=Microvirga roseola TaxID=2883126 RepID=UPI001E575AED|nr:GNAT family N-acetyltransferase [Microvirga roseola]
MEIRLADLEDLAQIEAVVHAAYVRYVPLIGREPGPMLDDYAALIARRQVHVLCDNGQVQGVLVLLPEDHTMLLDNVAVRPEAQGRGYGRQLIAFAEKVTRESGLRRLRLYTNEAMTENVALYERLGFIETHRGEEKGFKRVYMTKLLDGSPGT